MTAKKCKVCLHVTGKGEIAEIICCSPLCVEVYDKWRKQLHTDGRSLYETFCEERYKRTDETP